jgi:acyl-CoA thioester hydrolase
MDGFRFTLDIPVRYRDLDTNGHVNNATYATYFEQARLDYFEAVIGRPIDDDMALVHIEIDFRHEVTEADSPVTVGVRVPELGTSSYPMEYELRVGDELAAEAKTVQVYYDRERGKSRPIPEAWRTAFAAYEGL